MARTKKNLFYFLLFSFSFFGSGLDVYASVNQDTDEDSPIVFDDENVKNICLANWDVNADGELSYREAAAVTTLGEPLQGVFTNSAISSFNEFEFFTGLMSIENTSFFGCYNLSSIKIPHSVKSIEAKAFENCKSLTSITIPDGVETISYSAFKNCSNLQSVSIPNSLTVIRDNAFDGCSAMTTINIPDNVTSIGDYAFSGCISLPVENDVRYAGSYLVEAVKSLPSYQIRNGTRFIGTKAFSGSQLTSINIPEGVTSIGRYAFMSCKELVSIPIPGTTTNIGLGAFLDCSSLTSISIPKHVESIGVRIFEYCSSLTSIIVDPENPVYDSRDNCNAIIETSSNTLLFGCKSTIIPNTVTTIGSFAFEGCTSLTSIDIPNSVTSLELWAFCECSGLSSVVIPNSVTTISNCAFASCSNLKSVTIGSGVSTINNLAFSECFSLIDVTNLSTIPQTITDDVFSVYNKLHVLQDCKDAYQAAEVWNKFTIEEDAQGVQKRYYPEGTCWEEERYSELLGKKRSAYLLNTVCGDTIINETVYSKVTMDLRESDGHDALSDEPWWDRESPWHWLRIGTYFIRQDGDKVYYYGRGGWIAPVYDEPKERLALDFSWEKGKQLPGAIVVDSIYSITLADGNEYECVKKEGECVLVRGIGLVGKWFTLMGEQMHPNWDGSNPDYGFVLNFTRNGVKIYEWDRDAYLGIKENISEMKDEGLSIYTIQGIRIPAEDLSSLKPGIYIRGGHKYVVK